MRRFASLAALLLLAAATPAPASPRFLPQPSPEPLGVLVRNSRTIHLLTVAAVKPEGVTFKTKAALKGKPDEAPFRALTLRFDVKAEDLFTAGDAVLCFCRGDVASREGDAVAMLYARGRWATACSPIAWRGETTWLGWYGSGENVYALTYTGSTEGLREAVVSILARRETTITARAPQPWNASGPGRPWRIKAGLDVKRFVITDDSPYFVGWGTGDPKELAKLERALRAGITPERVRAAGDLAHLGAAARPALRRALKDSDSGVRLAAAGALLRLDPADKDGIAAIRDCLGNASAEERFLTIGTLNDLGPLAASALPELMKALADEYENIRAEAAETVGRVAQGSPSTAKAIAALAALLKEENQDNDQVRSAAVRALRCLGPQSWEALPTLRKRLSTPDRRDGWSQPATETADLLAQFDPPPVELLAELFANRSLTHDGRAAAAQKLGALGPRARLALPVLRRVVLDPTERPEDSFRGSIRLDAAKAILDIDPKVGPVLVTPVLLELSKERSYRPPSAFSLVARCGPAAKASVPDLLGRLDPEDSFTRYAARDLANLLGPEDVKLLPQVRHLLADGADGIDFANVLFRLGEKEKALAHAALCLTKEPSDQIAAARWLGKRGREAKVAEPALRRALDKATGAERARLALTLWRVGGAEGTEARRRTLAALDDLLCTCEGKQPGIGRYADEFWQPKCSAWEEEMVVGAAVATVLDRLRGKDDTVNLLAAGLRDGDPYVSLVMAVALAHAKPDHPDTVPALRKLLERHPHFFCFAVDTLVDLGPTATSLVPLVRPLLRHPNEDVSRAAGRVLRRFDPQAAKGWGAAGAAGAVPDDLVPLWNDLTTDDALCADLAVWRLAGAGRRAVTLLRERLRPPPALTTQRIARLIADLDEDAFDTRRRAASDLAGGIESAAPTLRRALADKPTAEARRSIQTLLKGLDPARDPEQRRRLRAVRLLEATGGAAARALLESLSRGDARFALTREATAALHRLDRP